MANKKITDLTELTTPAGGDFLEIVDVSESDPALKNKKIRFDKFGGGSVNSVTGDIVDNTDPANPVILTPTIYQTLDNNSNATDDNFYVGEGAGVGSTGTSNTGIGSATLDGNTGSNIIAIGALAGASNEFDNVALFGNNANADGDGQFVFSNGSYNFINDISALSADRKINWRDMDITPVDVSEIPTASDLIAQSITNGVTDKAPSENEVFDALALKEDVSNKENTTLDTSTSKYPTNNLVKTNVDLKAAKSSNLSDLASVQTARVNLEIDKRTTVGDANYTILSTDKEIVTSAALTAIRTWTLPSSINAGKAVIIADEIQGISSSFYLTIAVPSGKKLNGVTNGTVNITTTGGHRVFYSDGSDNYIYDAGIVRQPQLDLKLNKSKFITQGYTQITGVTIETVIASIKIPAGTYVSGESFEIIAVINKSITVSAVNFNLYHDTSVNGLTNAITTGISIANTNRSGSVLRLMTIDGTTLRNASAVAMTNFMPFVVSSAVGGTTTMNPAVDNWITITGNPGVITETVGINCLSVKPL